MSFAQRLSLVQARVQAACDRAGRDPAGVRLLAASKTRSADELREALAAGQRLFGENRAQELRDKAAALAGEPVEWHQIGPLQTNKVRYVVGVAALVHSVDRPALAEALSQRATNLRAAGQALTSVDVLIEVNLAEEPQKAGVLPADALAFAADVHATPHLRVRGLMCIPPAVDDPRDAAGWFQRLAALAEEGRGAGLPLDELSMGMSHDFEEAIRWGATLVRVGTALFGDRPVVRAPGA